MEEGRSDDGRQLGAKETARRKTCKVRFLAYQDERELSGRTTSRWSRSCYERAWCQQGLRESMQFG